MHNFQSTCSNSESNLRILTKQGSWMKRLDELESDVIEMKAKAASLPKTIDINRKAMIHPHAGHFYSGLVTAYGFKDIQLSKYSRIVLLGFSHSFIAQDTLFISGFDHFQINANLNLRADIESRQALLELDNVETMPRTRDLNEHSLEIILPFLNDANPDCKLLLVYVEHLSDEFSKKAALYFKNLYEDPNTLFLISSDFCHYGERFDYTFKSVKTVEEISPRIEDLDKSTINFILGKNHNELTKFIKKTGNTVCGIGPILFWLDIMNGDEKLNGSLIKYDQSCRIAPEPIKYIPNFSSVSYALITFDYTDNQ